MAGNVSEVVRPMTWRCSLSAGPSRCCRSWLCWLSWSNIADCHHFRIQSRHRCSCTESRQLFWFIPNYFTMTMSMSSYILCFLILGTLSIYVVFPCIILYLSMSLLSLCLCDMGLLHCALASGTVHCNRSCLCIWAGGRTGWRCLLPR